jgi:hypothetical protein
MQALSKVNPGTAIKSQLVYDNLPSEAMSRVQT